MKISKKATTIAVINQKGGTGKTTTCENLGVGLAMEGKKVLLVDADPQGSLTVSMGWQDPDALPTTLSTLMQKAMNDQCIPPGEGILHHAEGVDLIPANIELAGLEVALVNTMSREKVMKQVLESAKREYDYILIDCTPSLGMLTVNALAAADSALIPVQAQYLSAKGLEQLLQTVQKVRRQINPKLKIEGILLTMTDSRTICGQQISNLIRQAYGKHLKVFDQTIPRSVRAAETSTTGKSIFQYDPKGKVAEAYHSIAKGVLADAENGLNVSLNSYDDIFSTEETRQEEQREQVQQIPIDELYPFKDHPFKVLDDEAMQRTVESIKQLGVTNPLIARPRPDGGYEIISGHRRQHAAQLARLKTLPVIVRDMSDDAAVLLMVDSNLQREQILPSERAFAYKMKLDALKRQGARSDLTSSQVGMKLQALDIVGQEAGDSRNQVHRFIRLTNLIPELLDMVDEKKISFNPAVELSYLDESQQRDFLEAMADTQNAPSLSQAQRLKKLAQEGHFSYDVAFAVMGEPKKDELDKVVIKNDTLRKYFPESSTPREMEEKIIGLLEESKTEKVVFRSDSIKKYFPSNYSSEQIENSILKMLDQRMKKRKHEAER